jgi:hypothetical protein
MRGLTWPSSRARKQSEADLPGDFARAEAILKGRRMDVRLGNGYDVHAFCDGDHVWLCGVKVPHIKGCWAIPTPMSGCTR